ncbi:MAG: response regulator [Planctomycetota bacterium]|jgi:DNA-binding NarL/FixJ family response regulator
MTEQYSPSDTLEQHIGILVVDDHGLVRDGVCNALSNEKNIRVVGVANNADEAISKAIETKPHIVLIDIDMPGISCFDAIRTIRSRAPDTKFVILTAFKQDEYLEQAIKARANGYVTKSEGMDALLDAVQKVASGRIYFSPEVMDRLVIKRDGIEMESPPTTRLSRLSPRERELLRILAKGLSLKEAAAALNISYKTADKQKASLMAKLDIHDRVELARFAIREGMVQP